MLQALMPSGPARAGAERRASVRWRSMPPGPGRVVLTDSAETLDVQVLDLSFSGIGLLLPRRLELDTLLLIDLETRDERHVPLQLLARVARVALRKGGGWITGCAFFSDLSDAELEALL